MSTNALCPGPTRPAVTDHLLVARDYAEWCYALREAIAGRGNCTIIIDDRYVERRRRVQSILEEWRHSVRAIAGDCGGGQTCWSARTPAHRAPDRRGPGAD